jgi:hypothetical protein
MQHLNSALHPLRYSASVVRTTGAFFLSAATRNISQKPPPAALQAIEAVRMIE